MARIIYSHPSQTYYDYHIYTDLDFWDARRLLKDVSFCTVKRNFGTQPPGDEFPTQVVGKEVASFIIRKIEKRLRKAISSPPRHIIARSLVFDGSFEFDPLRYYPERWDRSRMIHFTYHRLALEQGVLSSPYQTVELSWVGNKMRIARVQREKKHDPVIRTLKEAKRHSIIPSCF
jgi:hypothetical protein